jgi:hypothetical protein
MSRHVFDWQKYFQYSAKIFAVVFQNQESKMLQISRYNWPHHKALQAVHVTRLVYSLFSFTSYLFSFL